MSERSLYRMDDILLKGASYLGIAAGLVVPIVWSASASGALATSRTMWLGVALLCVAPIAMGWAGYRIRTFEKRALALLKLIRQQVEFDADDLIRHSDWKRDQLDRAIRDLNNAGLAFVVWDRKSGKIQNGLLRRESVLIDKCGGCGAEVNLEVAIGDAGAIGCPYCNQPVDSDGIVEERTRVFEVLEAERLQRLAASGGGVRGLSMVDESFSIPMFLILAAVFWPAAVFYCFRHRQILQP